jgi:hypothetical protein
MTKFIIDPSSISQADILADVLAFLETKPDAEKWRDYFAGGAGGTVSELIAGLGTFLSYQTIVARRESFLRYAQNRSSLIGHAQNRGYSVYRGTNPVISITMIPAVTTQLNKLSVIGSVKDTDLAILETTSLVAGTPVTFLCTMGNVGTEEIQYTGNSGPLFLRFKQPLVSESIMVKLNGVEVGTSKRLIDAESGKFIVQSNAVGSVDIFYLNDPVYTIVGASDIIEITYTQYSALEFAASDVKLFYNGIQSAVITQRLIAPESNTSISTNAPIYAETQYVVRAREDYIKLLRLLNPSITQVSYSNVSPMVVAMHYLKDDLTLLTEGEKLDLIDGVSNTRSMGLEPPIFEEPVRVPLTVICNTKYNTLVSGVDTAIRAVTVAEGKLFGKKIDFEAVENSIEDLEGIKVARIEIGSTAWASEKKIQQGQHVNIGNSSNIIYKAIEILYKSGNAEPTWPTNVGDQVIDGDIVWECKFFERQCDPWNPELPLIPPRATWIADTSYKKNQIIIPSALGIFEYKVVELLNHSGSSEPVWTPLAGSTPAQKTGSLVYDGDILWQAVATTGTPTAWSASTKYVTGDSVIAIDQSASDTDGLMFQAVGYLGTTDTIAPIFPVAELQTVEDGNVVWYSVDKNKSPSKLKTNEFYVIESQVNLSNGQVIL